MNATWKMLAVLAFCGMVTADCMLQFPKGTRNRNGEQDDDANSNTRCFNSQTNAGSGVGVPLEEATLYYGAILSLEWTSQHGCLSGWSQCEWVLQWLCETENPPKERDGNVGGFRDNSDEKRDTTNQRVNVDTNNVNANHPDDCTREVDADNQANNCDTCRYENGVWWAEAIQRNRNGNLFAGVVDIGGDTAQYTRQNPNAERYGTEIQEERDYYPWFHPVPFIDIVVFTENITMCDWYQTNSFNVATRHTCVGGPATANNEADCTAGSGTWTPVPGHGKPAPDCLLAPHSRTNHNGNGDFSDFFVNYNFTISDIEIPNRCQIRLRYNITSADISWFADYRDDDTTIVNENNPDHPIGNGIELTLQVNPTQFSRTFEDRSSIYKIREAPADMANCDKTWIVGNKGRRGDIVEAYPAPENDYHPQRLHLNPGDCAYYFFTGTDAYDGGNAGGGNVDRDAGNWVQMNDVSENYPIALSEMNWPPALLNNDMTLEEWRVQAALGCAADIDTAQPDLDGAPYLCEMPIVKYDELAVYHYMNTRNNQWSNRSHKGTTHVVSNFSSLTSATFAIGVVLLLAGGAALMSAFYAKNHPNSTVARIFQNGGSRGSGILNSRGGSYGSYGQRSRGGSTGPSRGSRGSRGSRSRSHGSRKR